MRHKRHHTILFCFIISGTFSLAICGRYGTMDSVKTRCSVEDTSLITLQKSAESLLYAHMFDSCITVCQSVLSAKPGCKPFIDIMLNAALWSQNYERSSELVDYALSCYPQNDEYKFVKIKSLYFLRKYSESGQLLDSLIKQGYYHSDFEWLVPELRKLNSSSIQLHSVFYSIPSARSLWQFNSLGYGFRTGKVFCVPRFNFAQMIDKEHAFGKRFFYQYEIQLLPKLKHSVYPFISYAYSSSAMMPEHKLVAEVYKSLKNSKSVSAGIYFFSFHDRKELYTFSFSGGKSFGRLEFVIKPYFTFNSGDFVQSYSLITKKILDKYDNYFSLTARIGKTPFNPYYLIEDNNLFVSYKDYRLYAEFQHALFEKVLLKIMLGFGKDIYSSAYEQEYFESSFTLITYL